MLDSLVPLAVEFEHEFAGVVLVLDDEGQDGLDEVVAPGEGVDSQLVLQGLAQQVWPLALADDVLAHGVGLRHHHVPILQKRQLLKQPVPRALFLVLLPRVRVEEHIAIGHLQVLAQHPAHVHSAPVWIRPYQYPLIALHRLFLQFVLVKINYIFPDSKTHSNFNFKIFQKCPSV